MKPSRKPPRRSLRERLDDWWEGEWVEFDTDPNDTVVMIPNGYYKRPWIAEPAEKFVRWCGRNGWQITGTIIALASLYVGWLAVR